MIDFFNPSPFILHPYILPLAFLLDICIGDPRWLPHPVRIIGGAITKMESLLRWLIVARNGSVQATRFAGVLLAMAITGATFALSYAIISVLLSSLLTFYLSVFLLVYLTSTTIATRELISSARLVIGCVKEKDLESARRHLSMIVGRDTGRLSDREVLKATMETLAENLSDGVIAPLFYLAIGGLPLAMTYKAINTLDSMVGYRNDKYRDFGWASARLDDIANYVPARITGGLIVLSSLVMSRSLPAVTFSMKTMLRDGRKHLSPNSGIPEAAMAGALGIRMGGPSVYGGVVVEKPYIGENRREDFVAASEDTISLVIISSVLTMTLAATILFVRSSLW